MTRTFLPLAAAALILGAAGTASTGAQAAGPAGLTLPAPAVAAVDAAPVIKTGVRINLHFGGYRGYRRGYRRCFYKRFRHRHGGYRHWHTRRVCRWH